MLIVLTVPMVLIVLNVLLASPLLSVVVKARFEVVDTILSIKLLTASQSMQAMSFFHVEWRLPSFLLRRTQKWFSSDSQA